MRRIALVLVAAACATVPRAPGQGGPAWVEVASEHFLLRTDLDEERARAELRGLEELRAGLLAAILPNVDLPTGQIPVVVVRSRGEWEQFFDWKIAGMMVERVLFRPLILYAGERRLSELDPVKHELTHYIMRLYLPRLPPWFDEGIACFFETLEIVGDQVQAGRPGARYATLAQGTLPLDRLLGFERAPKDTRFYATSWLFVHYLLFKEPARFAAFRRYLQSPETAARAWELAFADRPLAQMADDFDEYVHTVTFRGIERPFVPPRYEARARRLGDLEAHRAFALLYLASIGAGHEESAGRGLAASEVEAALRIDPDDVEANALAVVVRDERGPALARRVETLKARRPGSWLTWALVALAAPSEPEREAAIAHARTLAGGDPAISFGPLVASH